MVYRHHVLILCKVPAPVDPTVTLAQLWRYGASKIMGSRLWPFVVTWRYRSRDHSTARGRVPMGGPCTVRASSHHFSLSFLYTGTQPKLTI